MLCNSHDDVRNIGNSNIIRDYQRNFQGWLQVTRGSWLINVFHISSNDSGPEAESEATSVDAATLVCPLHSFLNPRKVTFKLS